MSMESILIIAGDVRTEIEDWLDYDGDARCMIGECLHASRTLASRLVTAGVEAEAVCTSYLDVCDGYAAEVARRLPAQDFEPEAMEAEDGIWKHWVVVWNEYIIDITSDQFHLDEPDHPRVLVTEIGDPRYSLAEKPQFRR